MTQPHGRGHASFTYTITSVDDIDRDRLTVTITAAHSVAPITHRFVTIHRDTPVAERPPIVDQIFDACVDSIELRGHGGRWSSERTVENCFGYAGHLTDEFVRAGYETLVDPRLDLLRIRAVMTTMAPNAMKRTLTHLVARAIESTNRDDATTLSVRLRNTGYPADETGVAKPYTDEEIEVLRAASRMVLDEVLDAHRKVFTSLGFDTTSRAWWNITAEEAVAAARARDESRTEPVALRSLPPRGVGWSGAELVDWLLLNPSRSPDTNPSIRALGGRVATLHHGIYFPEHGIVAATILHCLLENRGYNYATLINTGADDLIDTGGGTGILRTAKARNHTQTRDGIFYGSKYATTGGLLLLVKALTRFSRLHRRTGLERLAAQSPSMSVSLADKFYVRFRSAVSNVKVYEPDAGQRQFRSGPLAASVKKGAEAAGIKRPTLRYTALRHHALYEGLKFDPDHDVVGHSPRARVDYLARCLPEATLHELGTAAQEEMHDKALRAFLGTDDGQQLASAVAADTAVDMVTNVCTSKLMDPDEPDRPCSLGLAACFTCKCGFRTQDHVPGLLALKDFTERVGATNPDEWAAEAGLLNVYATKSLAKFPTALVDSKRNGEDHENLVTIIAHLYTEFRRA